MKKYSLSVLIGLFIMFMVSMNAMAGTATIAYTEPSTNQAGNPINNLKETTIYWKQDGGVEQIVKVPAANANGGTAIAKTIVFTDPPVCGSTTLTVQASASNTNVTNFESARTAVVTGTKAGSTVGCATPNAPSSLTITIP